MAINWKKFQQSIDEEIEAAAIQTSIRLASQASSITRLTDDEIVELFPKPADVQRLKQLMEIVKLAENENQKIDRLVANIADLAGITVTLLEKFVWT